MASRNGKHHEWIESFLANKGIEKLERNVVVELIDYIKIYEDKRIEIVFRYADNYKEILNQIRYIQDNKNEMGFMDIRKIRRIGPMSRFSTN